MESQSISQDGYFLSTNFSDSSHGTSVKSKCSISDTGEDPSDDVSPSEDTSGSLFMLAGAGGGDDDDDDVLPCFCELARLSQMAASLASTEE